MSEGYRPDGPTTSTVRGMVAYENSTTAMLMILAQEIDALREMMVAEDERIQEELVTRIQRHTHGVIYK